MALSRLIRPLIVRISRVDKASITQNNALREPVLTRPFGERGTRVPGVRHLDPVDVLAQVEETNINRHRGGPGGNVPDFRTAFVCDKRLLVEQSLVDETTGQCLIVAGDRIDALYHRDGSIARQFHPLIEVRVTEVRLMGLGLLGRANLVMLVSDDRPQGLEQLPS